MGKFLDFQVECPFYLDEEGTSIICEGVAKCASCSQNFLTKKEKQKYMSEVCSVNGGKKCHHYRSVAILYERGIKN